MADGPRYEKCGRCGVLRPPHALEPYGTGFACLDKLQCCALRTGDVGTEGTQPRPGPNDTDEEPQTDQTPPNGVPKQH
jgi:hypothetical protein